MLPDTPMALATGRGRVVTERWPVGEVIDRAARMLRRDAARANKSDSANRTPGGVGLGARPVRLGGASPPSSRAPNSISLGGGMRLGAPSGPRPIRVDDVTLGLLDVRFDVGGDADGLSCSASASRARRRVRCRQSPPFVGRERELTVLFGSLDECVSEPVSRAFW